MSKPRFRPATTKDPTADRTCLRCKQPQPYTEFYATGNGDGRRRVCRRCLNAEARAKAGYRRHPRYNARGEVWCNNCKRYRHADHFKRHPYRPHTYWAYCKECTRELDRIRYRAKVSTPEGRKAVMAGRTERHRRQRTRELRARRQFIASSIDAIQRRGFTLMEVSKLAGISLTTLYQWRKGTEPSRAAEARIAIVLRATTHLPIGDRPTKWRRLPHPELPLLIKRLAPELAKHPMRSGWRYGARDHERRAA